MLHLQLLNRILVIGLLLVRSVVTLPIHSGTSFKRPIDSKSTVSLQVANFQQDACATALCTGLASGLLFVLTKLAKEEIIETKLCRKLIHTLSAPAFIVIWPLFSSADLETRVTASFLPILQFVRLSIAGLRQASISPSPVLLADGDSSQSVSASLAPSVTPKKEFNLADAISRSGARTEAFGGPMIYVTVLFVCILCFFRYAPV